MYRLEVNVFGDGSEERPAYVVPISQQVPGSVCVIRMTDLKPTEP